MVVEARLAHLWNLASAGHYVRIMLAHNAGSGKTKLKIVSGAAPDVVPLPLRGVPMATIAALRCSAATLSVVGRGHRHSSGLCESHFWLEAPAAVRPVEEPVAVACDLAPPAPAQLPQVQVDLQDRERAEEVLEPRPAAPDPPLRRDRLLSLLRAALDRPGTEMRAQGDPRQYRMYWLCRAPAMFRSAENVRFFSSCCQDGTIFQWLIEWVGTDFDSEMVEHVLSILVEQD